MATKKESHKEKDMHKEHGKAHKEEKHMKEKHKDGKKK